MKLKQGTTIAMLALAALVVFGMSAANATKPKPPPKPTQPVTQEQDQNQQMRQDQWQNAYGEAESASTANSESLSSATVNNDLKADGGSSDNAVAISNVYMSRAFAQDFPITHGCFVGVNAGGDKTTQTKSTGGFLGFTYLSTSCHLQALAGAERDIDIVARLRCGDRKYRNAVAYESPRRERQANCISKVKGSLMGAIEDEKQRLQELADEYKTKHGEVENLLVISQEHKKVCDQSLTRCETKVVGGK